MKYFEVTIQLNLEELISVNVQPIEPITAVDMFVGETARKIAQFNSFTEGKLVVCKDFPDMDGYKTTIFVGGFNDATGALRALGQLVDCINLSLP